MKKSVAVCIAAACVAAMVIVLATLTLGLQRQKIYDQPPLTHEELEHLYQKVNTSEESSRKSGLPPDTAIRPAGEVASGGDLDNAHLPRRLNRTLSDEERRGWYMKDLNLAQKVVSHIEYSPLACLVYYALDGQYSEQSELFYSGQWNLVQGNWAGARSCFSELARKSHGHDQFAFAYLAELEDDPELAARYMELASKGEHPYPVLMCRNLAQATGSNELAAYYGELYEEKLAKQQRPLQEGQ